MTRAGYVSINSTWRPTFDVPILNEPLALCDGNIVDESSLIECLHVDHNGGDTYNLYTIYEPNMRWYYLSHQMKHELLIFKHFDSADVPARFVPYAPLRHGSILMGCRARETAETLVYVSLLVSLA